MDRSAGGGNDEFSRVRIPGLLQSQFGVVFSTLERRVLRLAAQCALDRVGGSDVVHVCRDDVLEAVRQLLPNALSEVEQILAVDHESYVRRAS